jgi:hypothetical protein
VVNVSVSNRAKNPNQSVPQFAMFVNIERYEVRYYRSDGRNTEGVDVPHRISGNITTGLNAETSGGLDVPIEVVRAQAKLEPPLANLRGVTTDALGGSALIITCFAEVTLHGRTLAGQVVTASGRLQIDFADFPD